MGPFSAQAPLAVNWDSLVQHFNLTTLLNSASSVSLPQVWTQGHSLINIVHITFHVRVWSLEKPACHIIGFDILKHRWSGTSAICSLHVSFTAQPEHRLKKSAVSFRLLVPSSGYLDIISIINQKAQSYELFCTQFCFHESVICPNENKWNLILHINFFPESNNLSVK